MRRLHRHRKAAVAGLAVGGLCVMTATAGASPGHPHAAPATTTQIKHVVVIFGENVSFDHYFGTYKSTPGPNGEIQHVNNFLDDGNGGLQNPNLLTNNPNLVNPRRLDPTNINDVLLCDQDHTYFDEQRAFDNGKMDKFPSTVGTDGATHSPTGVQCLTSDVMNFYDGSAVTALWHYANQFAINDNSFGTTFGPPRPVPST